MERYHKRPPFVTNPYFVMAVKVLPKEIRVKLFSYLPNLSLWIYILVRALSKMTGKRRRKYFFMILEDIAIAARPWNDHIVNIFGFMEFGLEHVISVKKNFSLKFREYFRKEVSDQFEVWVPIDTLVVKMERILNNYLYMQVAGVFEIKDKLLMRYIVINFRDLPADEYEELTPEQEALVDPDVGSHAMVLAWMLLARNLGFTSIAPRFMGDDEFIKKEMVDAIMSYDE
nr:hypothetical protein K-LCC10_0242 [Kaumoebavirus]